MFPTPRTFVEGALSARYGREATSPAMRLLADFATARCGTHWVIPMLHSGPTKWLILKDDEAKQLAVFINERSAAGGHPFQELARAEKALGTSQADPMRLLVIKCLIGCHHFGDPFTKDHLSAWFGLRHRKPPVSSSTLTKGGALGGAIAGHEIGGDERKRNIAFPAAGGALGVAAYVGAKARGGVPAVAKKMIRDYAGVRDVARLRGVQVDKTDENALGLKNPKLQPPFNLGIRKPGGLFCNAVHNATGRAGILCGDLRRAQVASI